MGFNSVFKGLNAYNFSVENLEGMGPCGSSGVDGRIIFKKILRKYDLDI